MRYFSSLFLCIAILTAGCGYHYDDEESLISSSKSIAIPYVKGDADGMLTDALIKAVSLSNNFTYSKHGELILEGTIISDSYEHIGYQYDRSPVSGKRINRLIPNEGRREVILSISLIDASTRKTLYGPVKVAATSDFDFVDEDSLQDTSFIDMAGTRQSALFFSLGQLDSLEGARDVSKMPLYHKLARKIATGLENLSR